VKKTILLSLISMLVLSTTVFSTSSLAVELETYSEEELQFMETTDELLENYAVTPQDLENLGWELVSKSEEGSPTIQPLSVGGGAKVYNYFYKSSEYPGLYLAQSTWEYDKNWVKYDWESTAGNAYDIFAMSIARDNQALTTSAQKGGITVFDAEGVAFPGVGWIDEYKGSGVVFVISDRGGSQGVGSAGSAWFYISKPTTTSGEFMMHSRWTHTWSSENVYLKDVTFSFPLNISASWESSNTLGQWSKAGDPKAISW